MEAINIDFLRLVNKNKFINSYGLRSYTLWILSQYSRELEYEVPNSYLISSDLSIELSRYFCNLNIQPDGSRNYLKPDSSIVHCYYNYFRENNKDLMELAMSIDNGNAPIIRGTSCAEGYNNLSFAGVCYSSIPKRELSFEENVLSGITNVLCSIHSPYAQYYFKTHCIPDYGKNVGIIMMKMLEYPIFHATAYVYPNEIRVKYFFTPQTGFLYKGGSDFYINSENEKYVIKSEFGIYEEIWSHTINVLQKLPFLVYGNTFPVDVEFLITKDDEKFILNIVQIRKLSDIHYKNYKMSNLLPKIENRKLLGDIFVNKSYLHHSVIDCFGQINLSEKFSKSYFYEYIQIFVVKHQLGEGLFSFISSLPNEIDEQIGIIVTHPSNRSHDHFQYSIYEDKRIKFVIHLNEELVHSLKDGIIVHMISNGNEVIIREDKVSVKKVKILFIDENSLPDPKTVSAVFLVGYFGDKILTARNERGWDIPGGHVNQTDPNLFEALKRETYEESNTIIGSAKPYASIQFEGKDKVMLFYTSKDCILDEFVPKQDSFERKLMTIPEFISKYNWEKDVMKLLIERSLLVLKD